MFNVWVNYVRSWFNASSNEQDAKYVAKKPSSGYPMNKSQTSAPMSKKTKPNKKKK